ncbi:histidine phosphatase family protein [Apilactobacillus sp. HBW1]|uniref:Histidine phosphatase family protein n=1 Tax=Apilactobacillus waqarii TaxID=2851006 RepID=A0ABS6M518_9LACO|nr:histidine phosphatase family protein [Apilactobacillus waqarii]MBV0915226.1 histidine phosphatase family protein [Apilactobacillus waqarii]
MDVITFNLYVVRHGQTYFNVYNRLQGWSDAPLTDKGISGAEKTAEKLANMHFTAAYCSDTTRAMKTAKIILDKNTADSVKEPTVSSYLRGEFYGYYEGSDLEQSWYAAGAPHGLPTFKDIVSKYSLGKAMDFLKEADPFHQAESNEEYWKRWDQGLDLIRKDKNIHDGDDVLLISHANAVLGLVERFGEGKYDVTEPPANGSLTKLEVSDDQVKVTDYNVQ